jgi:hypothetical protein
MRPPDMHPTIDEQLNGISRLLAHAASETDLSASAQATFANISRLVQALQQSWSELPAFYLADNEQLTTLLADLSAATVSSTLAPPGGDELNVALRSALSTVIWQLPDGPHADKQRRRIRDYLLDRTAADPTLADARGRR